MSERPRFGVAISDISRSVHFYRDLIGLQVETDTGSPDTALLTTFQNQRFLFAGPEAPPWDELLAEPYTILRRGEKIFMGDPEFDERLSRLSENGVEHRLIERPWGDRIIEIDGPDGYGVSLWMIWVRTREQILEQFRLARNELRTEIEDLTDQELSWRPEPETWSIRDIVHHVTDANITVLHVVRVALAEPGSEYKSNPYDQNRYTSELRYRERDVEPSLRMFEAIHDVLVSMIEVVPDAWDRTVRTSGGGETNVETYMLMQATHALEHLEQIRDLRRSIGR